MTPEHDRPDRWHLQTTWHWWESRQQAARREPVPAEPFVRAWLDWALIGACVLGLLAALALETRGVWCARITHGRPERLCHSLP